MNQENGTLSIETGFSRGFVSPETGVYVRVGNRVVKKKAKDLNIGDDVIWHNESIDKSLDEIDKALREDEDYENTRKSLYEINSNGESISRFRILLLNGLADSDTDNLENKIMRNGDDFSSDEYSEFRKRIKDSGVCVKEDTTRDWLSGKTLSPDTWNDFSKLIGINSEFEDIANSFGKDEGYHANWEWYTGARKTLMAYIQKIGSHKDNEKGPRTKNPREYSGKYAKQISHVVRRFIQEIDYKKRVEKVVSINKTRNYESRKRRNKKGTNTKLKKGIFTEEHIDLPLVDMNQVRKESYLLDIALNDVLNKYFGQKIEGNGPKEMFIRNNGALYSVMELCRIHSLEEPRYEFNWSKMPVRGDQGRKDIEGYFSLLHSEFLNDLRLGNVDEIFGLEENTVKKLIEHVNQYRSSLPPQHFNALGIISKLDIDLMEGKLSKEEKRRKEKELGGISRYLRKTYGISRHSYSIGGNRKDKELFFCFHQTSLVISGLPAREAENESHNRLIQAKKAYEAQGHRFFTKPDVSSILDRLGIGSAIKIYDKRNFIQEIAVLMKP